MDNNIDKYVKEVDFVFGEGSLFLPKYKPLPNINWIDVDMMSIKSAFGNGIPRGCIIEVFGWESCLSEDNFIPYKTYDKLTGKLVNRKGGTIKRLYERFHKIKKQNCYDHKINDNVDFFVSSINENDCVIKNKIADVVHTGDRECFLVKSGNNSVICTAEHKFYVGNGKYVELKDLNIGDYIYLHDNTTNKKKHKNIKYNEVYIKYHPSNRKKKVTANDRQGNKKYKYTWYRVKKANIVYEAFMNEMSVDDYVKILNTASVDIINELWTVRKGKSIHHKDFDSMNDDISNLVMMDESDHYRLHANLNQDNLRFIATKHRISFINSVGVKPTYDIKCYSPYNNFVANKFVVHNSGKTTLALELIKCAQRNVKDRYPGFIDVEHALDPEYAKNIGVDLDYMPISQPESAELCISLLLHMLKSERFSVVCVDSVASMLPNAMLEGDVGDKNIALLAQLLSQNLPKIAQACKKTDTTVIFINQFRNKAGVFFGSSETTSGGNAMKFYAHIRAEMRKKDTIVQNSNPIGIQSQLKIVKNKVAPPFSIKVINILFGKGIDRGGDLREQLEESGRIVKRGSSYFLDSIKNYNKIKHKKHEAGLNIGNGKANADEWLKVNFDLYDKITKSKPEFIGAKFVDFNG